MPNAWKIEAGEFDGLQKLIGEYGDKGEKVINDVLHAEGAKEIKDRITPLIPRSGRKWKGKGAAAASVMPGKFQQDNELLSVTVAARNKYHYLYFPDDGSNTKSHVGNQQFMSRGAEAASQRIIEICTGKLTEDFGG